MSYHQQLAWLQQLFFMILRTQLIHGYVQIKISITSKIYHQKFNKFKLNFEKFTFKCFYYFRISLYLNGILKYYLIFFYCFFHVLINFYHFIFIHQSLISNYQLLSKIYLILPKEYLRLWFRFDHFQITFY